MKKLQTEWLFSNNAHDIFGVYPKYECENNNENCSHEYSNCQIITEIYCDGLTYEKTKIETINEVVKIELTYKIRLTENQINEIYNRIGFDLLIKKKIILFKDYE